MQRLRAPAAAAHHDAAAATAALGERGGGRVGSGSGSVFDVDVSVADDPSLVQLGVAADRRGEREGGAEAEAAAAAATGRDPRGADQGDQN